MKIKLIILLLAFHLILIYMGTGLFDFGRLPQMCQPLVTYYLSLVGGHDYAFFSPDIPRQTIIRCYITERDGHTHIETLQNSANSFELRSTYVYQLLSDNSGGYETAAKIAAGYMRKQHPHAKAIKVSIGTFDVPANFKSGEGYGFSEMYTQTFGYE